MLIYIPQCISLEIPGTLSQWLHTWFLLSISGNSSEQLHCGNFDDMPYYHILGTLTSVTHFAQSVSRNMDRLSLDDTHTERQDKIRRHRPQALSEGLRQGFAGLSLSFLGMYWLYAWKISVGNLTAFAIMTSGYLEFYQLLDFTKKFNYALYLLAKIKLAGILEFLLKITDLYVCPIGSFPNST